MEPERKTLPEILRLALASYIRFFKTAAMILLFLIISFLVLGYFHLPLKNIPLTMAVLMTGLGIALVIANKKWHTVRLFGPLGGPSSTGLTIGMVVVIYLIIILLPKEALNHTLAIRIIGTILVTAAAIIYYRFWKNKSQVP